MFDRVYLKARAKQLLGLSYWKCFLSVLVIGVISGIAVQVVAVIINLLVTVYSLVAFGAFGTLGDEIGGLILVFTMFIAIIPAMMVPVFFVSYPLSVGCARYFLNNQNAPGNADFNMIFFAFQGGRYKNIVKTVFKMGIRIFLWSLLLYIPGIIKAYEYRFVPYILADNPAIDSERALELSAKMAEGHKMEMFILDLSFTGWYLLGYICCGIGLIFVVPYPMAVSAELYAIMRHNALANGLCQYHELGFAPPPAY